MKDKLTKVLAEIENTKKALETNNVETIKDATDKLTKVLESMNYPYFQQGTMNKEEGYPESYFTFKNMSSDGDAFYNNEEHKIVWLFIVAFYSNNSDLIDKELLNLKEKLKRDGFIVSGKGYDVESDEPTQTGRGIAVRIIENL